MTIQNSTICAVSTPYGVGGIAVVRVSGEEAIRVVDTLFRSNRRGASSLQTVKAYTVHYGQIVRDEEVLDEVLVSVFRAPHSFTGEDVVEIACHGSLYIQQELLRWLVDAGCQMAKPGEFTQRAFANGKMDLSQAEAVADLIASESKAAHDLAINHIRGGISNELDGLREQLLTFTSLVELELDFADHEDLEFADRTELRKLADAIQAHISSLLKSFRVGNAIKNGIPVAIIGATNAGKSTLLNRLVGEERAIVSDIHGTTRDTIEDVVTIGGLQFRFIDTAGIRAPHPPKGGAQNANDEIDPIERIGMQRSIEVAKKADIILHVIDSTDPKPIAFDFETEGKTIITVYNKVDVAPLPFPHDRGGCATSLDERRTNGASLQLSAKNGSIEELIGALLEAAPEANPQGTIISNMRHYEALQRALLAIERVQAGMDAGVSGEFLSMDLQDCLSALGEITGRITSQEVLNNIFSRFCIGK